MSRATQENIMAIFLLMIFGAFLVATTEYGHRARLVPIPISVFSIIMILIDRLVTIWGKSNISVNTKNIYKKLSHNINADNLYKKTESINARPEWLINLVVIGLMVLIFLLGLTLGVFLFVYLYTKYINRKNFVMSFLAAGLVIGCLYTLFGIILGIELYAGFLMDMV